MKGTDQPDAEAPRYRPAWWVPGAHLQTLWGRLVRRRVAHAVRIEQWDTLDGDFVELLRFESDSGSSETPRLLALHGLEATIRSHYVGNLVAEFARRGWALDVLFFRSCGGTPNRARRFYHSGETGDLAFVIDRLLAERPGALGLAGVSLGGNVLLKYLGERGDAVSPRIAAAAAVSVPFDLARGSRFIDRGFSRVYQSYFIRSLKRKAREKIARFPDLVDRDALERARTLWDFDELVTAPVHGFQDAADYYARSSALRWIAGIRRSTLLLSAADDPFLPREVLEEVRAIARGNPALRLEFVARGGHVGFVSGHVPWRPWYYAEWRIADWLGRHWPRGQSGG